MIPDITHVRLTRNIRNRCEAYQSFLPYINHALHHQFKPRDFRVQDMPGYRKGRPGMPPRGEQGSERGHCQLQDERAESVRTTSGAVPYT
jgi:hypothetical protein